MEMKRFNSTKEKEDKTDEEDRRTKCEKGGKDSGIKKGKDAKSVGGGVTFGGGVAWI